MGDSDQTFKFKHFEEGEALSLANSYRRLERAEERTSSLEREVNEYLQTNFRAKTDHANFTIHKDYNDDEINLPELRVYKNTLEIINQPLLIDWALNISEIVFNLRSCLDYAVYELVQISTGNQTPEGSSQLQFPIFDHASKYSVCEKKYLLGMDQGKRDYIKSVQPFNNSNSLLHKFNELSKTDKHRFLPLTVVLLDGYKFKNPSRVQNPLFEVIFTTTASQSGKKPEAVEGMELSSISIHDFEGDRVEDYVIELNFALGLSEDLIDTWNIFKFLETVESEIRTILTCLKR